MIHRILDITTHTQCDKDGREIKNISFEWGVIKIDLQLTESEVNKLLRKIISEKGTIGFSAKITIPRRHI